MRLAVYAIALNEEKHVERFLATAREADLIVVADTGSTDNTVAAFRAGGAIVHQILIKPFRFEDARNAALALVPGDVDVCVSLDLDEVMAPGWRKLLEAAWTPETTHAEYRHISAHYADGRPAVEIFHNQIHQRHGYRWTNMIHEMLVPDRIEVKATFIPGMVRDHFPDGEKSRSQYMPMLEAAFAEEPDNPRHAYMLGREYVLHRRWAEAETTLRHYLTMKDGAYRPRRAAALRRIARCRIEQDDFDGGAEWLDQAMKVEPGRATYSELADMHRRRQDWAASYDAAVRGIASPLVLTGHSSEWRARLSRLHDLASIAAHRLGLYSEALDHAEKAAAEDPTDERLAGNVNLARAWLVRKGSRGSPPGVRK